jgi:23S rRNA (uracil1939-C5)-methyltransferase
LTENTKKSSVTAGPDIAEGAEPELEIEGLAYGGRGVARREGLVYFIDRGLPGQRVRARVNKVKKRFAEGLAIETLRQSEEYAEPFCEHFPECGGCAFQDLDYAAQLRWKRSWVLENLKRIAGFEEAAVRETLSSPETRRHRNKMEFAFAGSKGPGLHLGLRNRYDPSRLVDVTGCHIQSQEMNALLNLARETAKDTGVPAWNAKTGKGYWRYLIIRRSEATGGLLAQAVTAPKKNFDPAAQRLGDKLREKFPDLTFVHSIRFSRESVAQGQKRIFASGPGLLRERILGVDYDVPAEAFFQTNTPAAETLYSQVMEMAALTGQERVLDIYSGVGCPGLNLAEKASRVKGMEIAPQAVEYAAKNVDLNGVGNASFEVRDATELPAGVDGADVVVADPPRAGIEPKALAGITALKPERIVYVSCNPAALARDAGRLAEKYALREVRPVDLFPHAAHVECAALFTLLK